MHLDCGSTGVLKFDLLSSLPISPAALKNLLSALRTFAVASQVYTPLVSETSCEHLAESKAHRNTEMHTKPNWLNALPSEHT